MQAESYLSPRAQRSVEPEGDFPVQTGRQLAEYPWHTFPRASSSGLLLDHQYASRDLSSGISVNLVRTNLPLRAKPSRTPLRRLSVCAAIDVASDSLSIRANFLVTPG